MKLSRITLLFVCGLVLSGCFAAIGEKAGFDIAPAAPGKIQNPWEQSAIRGNMGDASRITVAYIPINPEWIGDGIGYLVEQEEEGGKKTTFWKRDVWPTIFFPKMGGVEFYSAVIHPCATHLIPIAPNRGIEELEGDFLILSGSSRFGHTTKQEIVFPLDVNRLIDDTVFRKDFFALHPSPLDRSLLRDRSPNTTEGQQFIAQIKERWPKIAEIRDATYTVNPDALRALSAVTNHASYLDRLISQGGMVISPVADLVSAAGMIPNILWNLGRAAGDKRLKGSFFEGQYGGRDIGLTFAPYLACSAGLLEAVEHYKAEIFRLHQIIQEYENRMPRSGGRK